jgi:hypothetical protein
MLSLFAYTQNCEETRSLMKLNKSDLRVRMRDQHQSAVSRSATSISRLRTGLCRITVQVVRLIVSTLARLVLTMNHITQTVARFRSVHNRSLRPSARGHSCEIS